MEPNREIILKKIGDHFQLAMQWMTIDSYASEKRTQNLHMAEALIELLEAYDCGSHGGFDAGQPRPRNLFERWDWLYRKYHNPEGKVFGCSTVSYEDIKMWSDRYANMCNWKEISTGVE